MPNLPHDFQARINDIRTSLEGVEGWLTDREAQFLAMLAACPTCEGNVLEIGSYCGRSAIALAKGAALSDRAKIHTVDIVAGNILEQNLRRARVRDDVKVFQMSSQKMLAGWRQPLRLFWHDGANDHATVSHDVETVLPFLADRAMVAFHDVLNTNGARIRVYTEKILENPHFGAVGVCGSIGWGQFRADPASAAPYARRKKQLRNRLRSLYPFYERYMGRRAPWPVRVHYKVVRSIIPHGRVNPRKWVRQVA